MIHDRVELANLGKNPYIFGRMSSGWLVIGYVQPLDGYCVLLADPVVPTFKSYDWKSSRKFDPELDSKFIDSMKNELNLFFVK